MSKPHRFLVQQVAQGQEGKPQRFLPFTWWGTLSQDILGRNCHLECGYQTTDVNLLKKFLSKCSHQEKIHCQTPRVLQLGLYHLGWAYKLHLYALTATRTENFIYKICKAIADALEARIKTQSCLDKIKIRSKSKETGPSRDCLIYPLTIGSVLLMQLIPIIYPTYS